VNPALKGRAKFIRRSATHKDAIGLSPSNRRLLPCRYHSRFCTRALPHGQATAPFDPPAYAGGTGLIT